MKPGKHTGELKGYKIGDWKMDSDYSGKTFLRSQMRKTWDGYWVHKDEWEPKHPQLSLKGVKDKQAVKPVRPRSEILIGTNLLLQSETFDNASWTKTNATVGADSIEASDGQTTADSLIDDSTNGEHSLEQSATIAPTAPLIASVEAQLGSQIYLLIKAYETGSSSNRINVWFNLSDGSVSSATNSGTATGATGRIERRSARGVVWYRCTALGTPSTSGTATTSVFQATNSDGGTSYVGDASAAIYLWGALAHAGDSPGNYVVTTTSTVDVSGGF